MKRMQNKEIGFKKQRICIGIDTQRCFALSQLKKEDAFLRIVFFDGKWGRRQYLNKLLTGSIDIVSPQKTYNVF